SPGLAHRRRWRGRKLQRAPKRLRELIRRRKETDNDVGLVWAIEEVPWMHQSALAREQLQCKDLLGTECRYSRDERPAAFDRQERAQGVLASQFPGTRQ